MNFLDSIRQRYTTKAYDGVTTLSDEQIAQLMETLRLAPSSINSQPWHFTAIGASPLKDELAKASLFNEEKVRRASHIIVLEVYRDLTTFEAERIADLHEYAQAYYQRNLQPHGTEAIRSWIEHQVYIALGVLLGACATMGIDSTPMEGIDREAYTQLLGHDKYRTLLAVAVGRRDPEDPNRLEVTPKRRRTDSTEIR